MSCPRTTRLATLALLLLSAACGSSHTGDPATTEFAPKLNVSLANMERRESGLYLQDLQVGTGAVASFGNIPSVVYSLWLPDGELVETNVGAQAFEFQLGVGHVIRGWDEGLLGMRVGGKRRLVIPSSLGYGDEGNGPIPGKAVLVFEVELRSIR